MLGKGDWGLKLLSIVLAVVLWIYVSNELNPTKEQDFKNISVDVRGVNKSMAVSELPETVNVKVSANQDMMAELTSKSIDAYIDLQNIKSGINTVPVKVKVPAGVTVVDFRPQKVQIRLEKIAEKQVPVIIQTTGSLVEGYRVLSTESVPDEVILRGPESTLKTIKNAFVEVQLEGKERSFSENIPIRLADGAGKNYDQNLINRTPQVAKVFTSVTLDLPSKSVKVIPQVIGEPAEGYSVSMTVVDPVMLQVTGQQKLIDAITEINTMPVDITGAKQDVFKEAVPNLPAGVAGNRQ